MGEGSPGNQYAHQIQNADIIVNQFGADTTQNFDAGLAALDNRIYPEAIARFRLCLAGTDAARAQAARGPLVLASLADRAAHRQTPAAIRSLNRQLELDTGRPLSRVLRALLDEDLAGEEVPSGAEPGPVDTLTGAELEALATHLAPMRGQTWRRVVARARKLGCQVELPLPYSTGLAVEPPPRPGLARRQDVGQFFSATWRVQPLAIRPEWGSRHYRIVGTVVAILVFAVGSGTIKGTEPYLAIGLGSAALLFWYAHKLAHPRPTEKQLDDWLAEDIKRTTASGLVRLGLRPGLHAQGGDLTADPAVIVGMPLDTEQVQIPRDECDQEPAHDDHDVLRAQFRVGADGLVRADRYQIAVLYPTDDGVEGYLAQIDPRTGEIAELAGDPLDLVGREPVDELFEFKAGTDQVDRAWVLGKVDVGCTHSMVTALAMRPSGERLLVAHDNKNALAKARQFLRRR